MLYGAIGAAFLADLAVGDPRWLPHPVRFIGWLCIRAEREARRLSGVLPLTLCGMLAFFAVLSTTLGCTSAVLLLLATVHRAAFIGGAMLLLYFSIACGDLLRHSRAVYEPLRRGDNDAARRAVALIVGRDTAGLDRAGICRACIESVAENLVDGITAPIFWALAASLAAVWLPLDPLGCAAAGAVGYKAINTMDSMYGYRNERYRRFGSWAAVADDAATFLPARLSGAVVVFGAMLSGYDFGRAARILRRDRLKSSSPNSGHTEAAVAGALGVRLGGASSYFGIVTQKPLIGAELEEPKPEDIPACNRLVLVTAALFSAIVVGVHHAAMRFLS